MKITFELPKEFVDLCAQDGVSPETVIRGFISDLAGIRNWMHPDASQGRPPRPNDGYNSHGSDERRLAQEYYRRVGYPYHNEKKIRRG